MSVYKAKGSPYYHYDFQYRGSRFHGSTRCKGRREAEQFERTERERLIAQTPAKNSIQLRHVIGRYWLEKGQFSANRATLWADLERLSDYLGEETSLSAIDDEVVAGLAAWRRGHRVVRSTKTKPEDCPLVRPATVNRSTVDLLRRLFRYAGVAPTPAWGRHRLAEPRERVRVLHTDERQQLHDETRDDYAAFFAFAATTGLRLRECLLRWTEIDWDGRRITKTGKGGKLVSVALSDAVRAILAPLRGQHPEFVFTYVARRSRGDKVKGKRYPLTYSGVKTQWKRLRRRAGVKDFRFHDFRHDVGTRLLRETGSLKLVQRALNHADLRSTARYAHVLDDEVANALDRIAAQIADTESRENPRTKTARKV